METNETRTPSPSAPAPGLDDAQIAEWERLANEATPGLWEATALLFDRPEATPKERAIGYVAGCIEQGDGEFYAVLCEKPDGRADVCHAGNGPTSGTNAAFLAAARTAVPALVAEVRRLRALRPAPSGGDALRVLKALVMAAPDPDFVRTAALEDDSDPASMIEEGARVYREALDAARRTLAASAPPPAHADATEDMLAASMRDPAVARAMVDELTRQAADAYEDGIKDALQGHAPADLVSKYAAPPATPEPAPRRRDRCSVCGSPRIPLDKIGAAFGACSLVPSGAPGDRGCPDPLHDYYEERPYKRPGAAPTEGTAAPEPTPAGATRIVVDKEAFASKEPDRGFTVRASYLTEPKGEALIEIERDGKPYRRFLFPSYKVWNIAAHFADIVSGEIEGNLSGYDAAGWDGFSVVRPTPLPAGKGGGGGNG